MTEQPAHLRILSSEQIDQFRGKGFVRIGRLLDEYRIAELRTEYDRVFDAARHDGRFRNLSIDDTEDRQVMLDADEQMLQIMQMCERSLIFRRLLYEDTLLDITEDLIGPNIQLFHDQALCKPAFQGGPVFWHQDNAYWKCIPANLVSCWLTLDDVDASNGAMHVVPASHLRPQVHERSATTGALLDYGSNVDNSLVVPIELPAGGVMIHHCLTLHSTPPNRTCRQRRAFVIHYMSPGTRSGHDGKLLKVSFQRPLLRSQY